MPKTYCLLALYARLQVLRRTTLHPRLILRHTAPELIQLLIYPLALFLRSVDGRPRRMLVELVVHGVLDEFGLDLATEADAEGLETGFH